jgi:hypothetical protein
MPIEWPPQPRPEPEPAPRRSSGPRDHAARLAAHGLDPDDPSSWARAVPVESAACLR